MFSGITLIKSKHAYGFFVNSTVYKWSELVLIKQISVTSVLRCNLCEILQQQWPHLASFKLLLTIATKPVTVQDHNMHWFIYKRNGSKFMRFQSIPTSGDYALYPFIICGQTYIAAINHYDGEKNVERRSTTSDMCTSPLETTFSYHIPRNFYPSGDIFYYSETENKYRIKRKLLKWI